MGDANGRLRKWKHDVIFGDLFQVRCLELLFLLTPTLPVGETKWQVMAHLATLKQLLHSMGSFLSSEATLQTRENVAEQPFLQPKWRSQTTKLLPNPPISPAAKYAFSPQRYPSRTSFHPRPQMLTPPPTSQGKSKSKTFLTGCTRTPSLGW